MKTLKLVLFLAIVALSSCKKSENENPQPKPAPKPVVVVPGVPTPNPTPIVIMREVTVICNKAGTKPSINVTIWDKDGNFVKGTTNFFKVEKGQKILINTYLAGGVAYTIYVGVDNGTWGTSFACVNQAGNPASVSNSYIIP